MILEQTCHSEAMIPLPSLIKNAIVDDDVELAPIYRSWGTF